MCECVFYVFVCIVCFCVDVLVCVCLFIVVRVCCDNVIIVIYVIILC